MAEEKLENPYDEGDDGQEFALPGKSPWVFAILFLLGIAVFPIGRHLHELSKDKDDRWVPAAEFLHHPNSKSSDLLEGKRKGNPGIERATPGIRDHLQAFEGGVKDAPWAGPPQQFLQRHLTTLLREGNPKCFVGTDGWFFYQPALDALSGYGPLKPEPDSVTKDPDRPIWSEPLPEVVRFANELRERGVPLLLVPVPTKGMIYPEKLGLDPELAPLHHRDREAFFKALAEAGIETLDLLPPLVAAKEQGQLYLKQDTHWTQLGMRVSLEALVEKVTSLGIEPGPLKADLETVERSHMGDLVGMLEINVEKAGFQPETEEIVRVLDPETGEPLSSDPRAPVSLLGDSFVNVFHDPAIGFEDPDNENALVSAGLGQHLAARLGQRIDLIAKNGGGATVARQEFARHYDNVVRSKKLVIWILAERDLFLSATPAGKDVLFRPVSWNPGQGPTETVEPEGDALLLTGTLKQRSAVGDPKATPYADSLFTAEFAVDAVDSGEISDPDVHVVLWGFRARKLLPSSKIEEGKAYKLRLVPFSTKPELKSTNLSDDLLLFSDQWFAEAIEPVN